MTDSNDIKYFTKDGKIYFCNDKDIEQIYECSFNKVDYYVDICKIQDICHLIVVIEKDTSKIISWFYNYTKS